MRIDLSVASEAVGAALDNQGVLEEQPAVSFPEVESLPRDTASFSGSQTSVSALTQQALATGDTRSAKVDALQQAVGSGGYKVDAPSIADAIIGEWA